MDNENKLQQLVFTKRLSAPISIYDRVLWHDVFSGAKKSKPTHRVTTLVGKLIKHPYYAQTLRNIIRLPSHVLVLICDRQFE